jgi:hypothetical protein
MAPPARWRGILNFASAERRTQSSENTVQSWNRRSFSSLT